MIAIIAIIAAIIIGVLIGPFVAGFLALLRPDPHRRPPPLPAPRLRCPGLSTDTNAG
jgi:hypothetical protein